MTKSRCSICGALLATCLSIHAGFHFGEQHHDELPDQEVAEQVAASSLLTQFPRGGYWANRYWGRAYWTYGYWAPPAQTL
jgi:hypothetical protein